MENDNNDDDVVYNADTYTDEELLEFLDLSPSATDRELEAKIVQMINQYPETPIQTFFKDVYRRFFKIDELEEEEEKEEKVVEGIENRLPAITLLEDKQAAKKLSQKQIDQNVSEAQRALTASDEMYGNVDPRLLQSVVLTKGLEYVADPKGLNPMLNNTIQRVLIIDSRCRDRTIYPSSTDFTLNLSENLKHVLALNFYYVNVPYTWYTISKAYGANLIFLNGNAPGIASVDHALRLSIEPGNYTTPEALVQEVNAAIQRLAAVRTDISFGTSGITLTSTTAGSGKATLTWDIQNRFGDANFSVVFPYWTSPADATLTTLNNGQVPTPLSKTSIPGFLGFLQNNTYPLASLFSNFDYAYVAGEIDLTEAIFQVDLSNNTFYVYNHASTSTVDPANPTTYYDRIPVTVATGPQNRSDLMNRINAALQSRREFDPVRSLITFEQTTFFNSESPSSLDYVQRFRLTLQLNRFFTQNRAGQCQTVIFPDESLRKTNPVWTGPDSAFYFSGPSALRLNSTWAEVGSALGTVAADTGLASGSTYTYAVTDSPTIRFVCQKYPLPEINAMHSFTITIPNNDTYTLATHLQAINDSIREQVPMTVFPSTCRLFYYDYYGTGSNYALQNQVNRTRGESAVYAEIGLQRMMDYSHFTIDATSCFLNTAFGLPARMDFSPSSMNNSPQAPNVYESTFSLSQTGYLVNNQNRKMLISSKNGDEPPVTLYFPYAPKTTKNRVNPTSNDNKWYLFPTLASLQQAINTGQFGFAQYQNRVAVYQQVPDSSGTVPMLTPIPESQQSLYGLNLSQCKIEFTLNPDGVTAKCKLSWNISNMLTEQDYRMDLRGTSWSDTLGFASESSSSFVLSDLRWSPVGSSFATIYGQHDVKTSAMNIVDSSFPNVRVQNNQICLRPNSNADSLSSTADLITLSIAPSRYNRFALVRALNAALFTEPVTAGTQFVWCGDDLENVRIDWNVNKIYTAQDYTVTFFDVFEFGHCEPHTTGNSSLTTIRWDQTLGWLLGYRSLTSYNMLESVALSSDTDIGYSATNPYTLANGKVTIQGDTPVNVYLYNQLHVVLDDFTSNHMNDGIVTVAPPNAETTLPSYANRALQRCDVQPVARGTGSQSVPGFVNTDPNNMRAAPPLLSQKQLYSAVARLEAQRNLQNAGAKKHSPSPNVKDMFALIPLKLPGLQVGQTYTEFGGTLQQNNRKYFGPVTIRRLGIKLVSDRGDVVDLNNNDWSVGIICDISIQRS
jgi:hypothetical protein